MTKPTHNGPIDALGAAYEKMYERAAQNLHSTEKKSAQLLHKLIDEAKDKAVELKELSEEDAAKLADWLKRDLDDTVNYLSETGLELKDWLGFETTLLESAMLDLLLKSADKTTVELLTMKDYARQPHAYHTGEITGPGTLVCDQCGEKLHFHRAGKIPPCPKCHATTFHR
jgi:hypothetical protein